MSIVVSQAMFFAQAAPVNPFAKLTPRITKEATIWAEKVVNTLSEDLQLTYLNLFALNNDEDSIQAFIRCAEYIESQPEMLSLYEELGINIMETIKTYAEAIQEKIAAKKKNITDQEKETLWQKLEIKIQELLAYINTIYYQTLYSHIAKKTSSAPKFMFDNNGIVAAEKRTRSLPQPL